MSRNQKAPLLAFVLVAMVCGLVLADAMRGDASGRREARESAPSVQSALPQPETGREPSLPSARVPLARLPLVTSDPITPRASGPRATAVAGPVADGSVGAADVVSVAPAAGSVVPTVAVPAIDVRPPSAGPVKVPGHGTRTPDVRPSGGGLDVSAQPQKLTQALGGAAKQQGATSATATASVHHGGQAATSDRGHTTKSKGHARGKAQGHGKGHAKGKGKGHAKGHGKGRR